MHSKSQRRKLICHTISQLALIALVTGILPARAQNAIPSQNSVPPTARQSATMPEFASRLAHPGAPRATSQSTPLARKHPSASCSQERRGWIPDDQISYENGPVNGTTYAWTINFGYVVSDSFIAGTISGFDIWTWEFPSDVVDAVDWSITSAPNGGTVYGSGTASGQNLTDQFISTNQYGYDIDKISVSGLNVSANGTVWLNLQNASVPSGDPVYWDENSGIGCHSQGCPSQAYQSSTGSIPSEAFDVVGGPPLPPCFQANGDLQIIHDYTPSEGGPAGVTIDKAGNLYGVSGGGDYSAGMAYRMASKAGDWLFTPLYSFLGGDSGSGPSPVIVGPDGALYGAATGGLKTCGQNGNSYCGLIFRLRPTPSACATVYCGWQEDVLYRFTGTGDGWAPGNLSFDSAGNLYGIAAWGIIFELSPSPGTWTEQTLYTFTDWLPNSLIAGNDGNLYGITGTGGESGDGTIFQLVPSGGGWTRNILYNFQDSSNDGLSPENLHQDSFGNLYGTSYYPIDCGDGYAIVFRLSPSSVGWIFLNLFPLNYGPNFTLIDNFTADAAGSPYFAFTLYTYQYPWGMRYQWTRIGGGTDWYTNDWFDPSGPLAVDAGHLYGTTPDCGKYYSGTLWSIPR